MKKFFYLLGALAFVAHLATAQVSKRFANHTEFGGLFGRVKYGDSYQEQIQNKLNLTIQTFNGMYITPKLAAGVTVGMDWYRAALLNPIAAGARYNIVGDRNLQLFGTLDAGYGFAWFHQDLDGYDTRGGLMLNPGIGIRIGKQEGAGVTIALTYKRQEAQVDKPPFWDQSERTEHRVYNRLAIRFGFRI